MVYKAKTSYSVLATKKAVLEKVYKEGEKLFKE